MWKKKVNDWLKFINNENPHETIQSMIEGFWIKIYYGSGLVDRHLYNREKIWDLWWVRKKSFSSYCTLNGQMTATKVENWEIEGDIKMKEKRLKWNTRGDRGEGIVSLFAIPLNDTIIANRKFLRCFITSYINIWEILIN